MNFRTFLEMGDLSNRDTSHIAFSPDPNDGATLKYQFFNNAQAYAVYFTPDNGDVEIYIDNTSYQVPHSWTVNFTGPQQHSQTNQAGTKSHSIYTQVLLAIKKLLETYPVNGLAFSGYSRNMDVIYDRFYKQYLAKDFLRISAYEYIKKSYLKNFIKQHPEITQNFYQDILDNNRTHRYRLQDAIYEKQQARNKLLFLKKHLNSFIYLKYNWQTVVAFLYEFDKDFVRVVIDSGLMSAVKGYVTDVKEETVPQQEILAFLHKCKQPNQIIVHQFLTTTEGQPLQQLINHFIPNTV